jgi:undecaprenyl diphosphate synthase
MEVASLMDLFVDALDKEITELQAKGVRVRFIGARRNLSVRLQARIAAAEERTAANARLKLQLAVSYGGRWDIVQAAQRLARECASGALRPEELTEARFAAALELAGLPEADLLIRTGGEQRISNFLLWELAYAELFFTPRLWPDFALADFEEALRFFAGRERRFGQTAAQRAS